MSLTTDITCQKCGQLRIATRDSAAMPTVCDVCREAAAAETLAKERQRFLERVDALPTKQALLFLAGELFDYVHRKRKRVGKLF